MANSRSPFSSFASNVYYWYKIFWEEQGDPRVVNYPFFRDGPWYVIAIVLSYIYFIRIMGPKMMKNRPAYDLRFLIFFYNLLLVLLNLYFVYHGTIITNFGINAWRCINLDSSIEDPYTLWTLSLGYLFFLSKLFEFLDTVFFILRKKFSQASNLHVIHHSLVPILVWLGFKLYPGGNNMFFPYINSIVHVIMYCYYALSTLPKLAPYLWWKKYLTVIQMLQFILIIVHSLRGLILTDCRTPRLFIYISIFNAILFLGLFYSFYEQRYNSSGKINLQKSE